VKVNGGDGVELVGAGGVDPDMGRAGGGGRLDSASKRESRIKRRRAVL